MSDRNMLRIASLLLIISSAPARSAADVECPVCGESFPDGTEECPNDGTKLKLVGIPSTSKTSPDESNDKENVEKDAPAAKAPAVKYRRHDQGGDRRPLEQSDPDKYSDRMSRIPGDRRIPAEPRRAPEKKKSNRPDFSEQRDRAIIEAFDARRSALRETMREQNAQGPERRPDDAQKRLLNSLGAPLTSLGGRVFWLPEGASNGLVGGAEIDIHLARQRLRVGFSTMLGLRMMTDRNEVMFLETLNVGIQWPRRFSPFVVARGGVGMLKTKRFQTDQSYLVTSVGLEAGIDAWIIEWIALTPSMGYARCTVDVGYWNSFSAKLSIGF